MEASAQFSAPTREEHQRKPKVGGPKGDVERAKGAGWCWVQKLPRKQWAFPGAKLQPRCRVSTPISATKTSKGWMERSAGVTS